MKSSWFTRISATSVIATALGCALLAPVALAADPPAADTTNAAAPAAVNTKQARRLAKLTARTQRAEQRARDEAVKQGRKDAEDKVDRDAGFPWIRDANWMSFRVGTARSAVRNAPDGNIGLGFGMYHFLNHQWAAAFHADVDVLGKFSGGTEAELPLTLEMTRHFRWRTPSLRPYVGLGAGTYFHKYTRTGADQAELRPGLYLSGGLNTPIAPRSLLGVDVRVTYQGSAQSDNPLFPNGDANAMHWSFKVNYLRWI